LTETKKDNFQMTFGTVPSNFFPNLSFQKLKEMASLLQNDPSLVEKLDSTPGDSLAEKLKTFLQNRKAVGKALVPKSGGPSGQSSRGQSDEAETEVNPSDGATNDSQETDTDSQTGEFLDQVDDFSGTWVLPELP
jgi:hypothetical protein